MGMWTLLEGLLLLANALAILNEERFLAPRGWGFNEMGGAGTRVKSLKGQIIGLVHAIQYLRLPLIALNTVVAISMLISGLLPQQQQATAPAQTLIKDLRPAAQNNVNTTFIILEKGSPMRSDGGLMMSINLAADSSASVHLQLWGNECEAFQPGDIVRLTNGICLFHKTNLVLRAGKKGKLEKVGEFTMVFVENPNMSRLQWIQEPSNPTQWVPVGLNNHQLPQGAHSSSGGTMGNHRVPHQERL